MDTIAQTKRVKLRSAAVDDWKAVKQLFLVFASSPYYIYDPVGSFEDDYVKNWVQDMVDSHILYVVSLTDSPLIIGYVCFHKDVDAYDIGYLFFNEYKNKGYATEAAKAAMDVLAEKTGIHKFTAIVAMENLPSVRVLEKLGFSIVEERTVEFNSATEKEGTYTELRFVHI